MAGYVTGFAFEKYNAACSNRLITLNQGEQAVTLFCLGFRAATASDGTGTT